MVSDRQSCRTGFWRWQCCPKWLQYRNEASCVFGKRGKKEIGGMSLQHLYLELPCHSIALFHLPHEQLL